MPLQETLPVSVAHSGREELSRTVPAETALYAALASPGRSTTPLLAASSPLPLTSTGCHGRSLFPSRETRTVAPTARHTVSPLSVASRSPVTVVQPADADADGGGDGDAESLPSPPSLPASVPHPASSRVSAARARAVRWIVGRMGWPPRR